jgi:hypothetical protein
VDHDPEVEGLRHAHATVTRQQQHQREASRGQQGCCACQAAAEAEQGTDTWVWLDFNSAPNVRCQCSKNLEKYMEIDHKLRNKFGH